MLRSFKQLQLERAEFEQALLRPIFHGVFLTYLFFSDFHRSVSVFPQINRELIWFFFLYSFVVLISFYFKPTKSITRRVTGIIADVTAISYVLASTGEIGAAWAGVYIWIVVGNGGRFGKTYLLLATILAAAGFLITTKLNEFWLQHTALAVGFFVTIVGISLFTYTLFGRLNREKQKAIAANQAKSDFLARMSHEIRTPLNGIISTGELLRTCNLDSEQQEYADIIHASGNTLLKLIEDILDISKIEAGKLELENTDFDLHSLINSTIRMLSPQAESKKIKLSYRIGLETPYLLIGDPHHLRQVLINLVGNAIKFTDKGSVELHCHTVRSLENRSLIRFEIVDTGIGIDEEAQTRIFENFSQADESTTRKYGGTGLGTAIARQLVELMGGRIRVQSTPKIGSTFWFDIEFQHQSELVKEEAIQQLQESRVIRLCSQPGATTDISHTLKGWGVPFIDVADSREAIRLLIGGNTTTPYEVIILDDLAYSSEIRSLLVSLSRDLALSNITVLVVQSDESSDLKDELSEIDNTIYVLKQPVDKALLFNALHASRVNNLRSDGVISLAEHFTRNRNVQRPLKILVAEDNSINRIVTGRILEHAGHQHHAVENGLQVLDALESETYDLVIVDMQMPELGGIDAYRMYRFAHASEDNLIPFIMLTANATTSARQECEEAGIKYFLTKPVVSSKLLETILQASKHLTSSQLTRKTKKGMPDSDKSDATGIVVVDESIFTEVFELSPDKQFMHRLFDRFSLDSSQVLFNMQEAAKSGDSIRFRALAHALKSSSLNLGLLELSSLASNLEKISDTMFADEAARGTDKARVAIERAKAAMSKLLDYPKPAVH